MSSEDEGVIHLIAIRDKLDQGIQGLKDKIAIIYKRRTVLQAAIDVMRSGDKEVDELVYEASKMPVHKSKPIRVDWENLDRAITEIMSSSIKNWSKRDIAEALAAKQVPFNMNAIKRTLLSNPNIIKKGERDLTVYTLK